MPHPVQDSTREALQRAAQLLQRGAADEARAALSSIVAHQPDNAEALGLLGIAHGQRRDYIAAASAFERAATLGPGNPGVHLNYGNVLRRLDRLDEAAESFRRSIALRPDALPARRQLGSVLLDLHRYQEALDVLTAILQQTPRDAVVLNDRGLAYLGLGRIEPALADFDAATTCDPQLCAAWTMRGKVLRRLGRVAEAIASFEHATSIDAADWDAFSGLGIAHSQAANFPAAVAALNRAASLRPDHAPTYLDRARVARALGNNPAALFDIENALRLEPANVDALLLRAAAHRAQELRPEALADCERALEIDAGNWSAHNNRGVLLEETGRPAEALASFERSLELNPDNPDAIQNIGTTLLLLKRGDDAIRRYDAVLALDPANVAVHNCKGAALIAMRRFDEALESFDRAVARQPDSAISNFQRAFALLAQGRLREGFQAYEWRRRGDAPFVNLPRFAQPELQPGEDPRGKRLLIHGEQGLGDVVQYARYARIFADRGATVVFAVYPALRRLMTSLGDDITVVAPEGPAPEFDMTCPLLSAPYVLGTTIESIPGHTPYLAAPPDSRAAWRARLQPHSGTLRVGLAWSGNPQYANDWTRSLAFEQLRAILDVPGVTFFNVQKDVRAGDEESLSRSCVVDVRNDLTDFAETAALISELDLVIAVDTSIAHLAGALGRPVWILLSAVADWRWFEHRSDSPWYPTARLFRQRELGDWGAVFADVRARLIALADERGSGQ